MAGRMLAALCIAMACALCTARPVDVETLIPNETPCEACTGLFTMLQGRLEDPTMQQQLLQYVIQDVCPSLPSDTRTQCSIFAPLVIASAIGWVREQSPALLCTKLTLCPDEALGLVEATLTEQYVREVLKHPELRSKLSGAVASTRAQPANDDCDMCQIAVLEMATILADPDTQKDVLDYGKEACESFPAFEDQCVAYVETYGPMALATAIAYLQPALCANLGFCPVGPPALQQSGYLQLGSSA